MGGPQSGSPTSGLRVSRSEQDLTALARSMEKGLDHQWLAGEPRWWRLPDDASQPDVRKGEANPPESWRSTTSKEGGRGWARQRLKPVVSSILIPLAWSPMFLFLAAVPLALPGRLPTDDQSVAALFFTLTWVLVLVPLYLARSNQPMSEGSVLSLPFDWATFVVAAVAFPLHILVDPVLGWISYALFWIAWVRTYRRIEKILQIPAARWLLPIDQSGWNSSSMLPSEWQVISENWTTGSIARINCEYGHLSISGVSRGSDRFLALTLLDGAGFVHDPFSDGPVGEALAGVLLSQPPVSHPGLEWPERLLVGDAQSEDAAPTAGI